MSLLTYPRRRIVVPIVAAIRNAAQRRLDVIPTPFIVERPSDEFGDEGATTTGARTPVEFYDEGIG